MHQSKLQIKDRAPEIAVNWNMFQCEVKWFEFVADLSKNAFSILMLMTSKDKSRAKTSESVSQREALGVWAQLSD